MSRKRRGRGEGSIRYRADKDLWVCEVRLPNGKRRTAYAKTKAEAQEKLREMQNEGLAGIGADPERRTVGQYLSAWLETTAKRSLRNGTWVRYEQLVRLRLVPHLGEARLDKLTPCHVEQLLSDLEKAGVKPRGQQMAVNVLGRACKDAVRLKLIASNPVRDVVKPKPPKPEMQVYGPDEVSRFLAGAATDRLSPCTFWPLTRACVKASCLPWNGRTSISRPVGYWCSGR